MGSDSSISRLKSRDHRASSVPPIGEPWRLYLGILDVLNCQLDGEPQALEAALRRLPDRETMKRVLHGEPAAGHRTSPTAGCISLEAQVSGEECLEVVIRRSSTNSLPREVDQAAIFRGQFLLPSPESPAMMNARGRNYSVRNAKRTRPSGSSASSRKRS